MTEQRRPRRWRLLLSVLAVLLVIGWWVDRQLEPNRLTAIVLQKAGESLQLKLRFEGQPDYALKPEPRLLIPNLSVSAADGKVFLFAKRAEISLPWSTITGDDPVITRIELEQPKLDLPGLRTWLATRPAKPFELPTLTKGLEIIDGTVTDDGYSINKLVLKLPHLKTGDPAKMASSGTFTQGNTEIAFVMELGAKTPGLESDFTLHGTGALKQSPEPLKFQLHSDGHYVSADSIFSLDSRALKFVGVSPLPELDGKGRFSLDEQLRLDFDGILVKWPKAWPALPQPLAVNTEKLPLRISYTGKTDFSDPVSLIVTREPTQLQASLRVDELQEWIEVEDGSPVPPINGTLRTPSMDFDGVELQGVEIEVSDGESSVPPVGPAAPP